MKKFWKYSVPVVRVLLGLSFFVFGLNGFLNFIPISPPEGAAGQFMGGLAVSGYFFPLLKGTELVVGLLLLTGRLVPLALTILAPITIHIVAFHLFLAPEGTAMGVVFGAMQLYLAYAYRAFFAGVLEVKAAPKGSEVEERTPLPDALEGIS